MTPSPRTMASIPLTASLSAAAAAGYGGGAGASDEPPPLKQVVGVCVCVGIVRALSSLHACVLGVSVVLFFGLRLIAAGGTAVPLCRIGCGVEP